MYWNIEQRCRSYTTWMAALFQFNQTMTVLSLFLSIYCIYVGDVDTSTWQLPYPCSVPYDTKEIWKWYTVLILEACATYLYTTVSTSLTSYFTCCCWYIDGICDHFDMITESIRIDVERNRTEKNPRNYWKRSLEMKRKFCQRIEIQVKAFE